MKQKEETGNLFLPYYLAAIFSVILIDQLSKFLIGRNMGFGSYAVINNFLYITLVRNTGAAFGMLKGQNILLIIITLLVIAAALRYLIISNDRLANIGLCLILGGAIGNLIDRIIFGYVIDFIDVGFWPVFNIADSAVTVGVVLFGLTLLINKEKQKR